MTKNKDHVSISGSIVLFLVLVNALIAKIAFIVNQDWYWALIVTLPMLAFAVYEDRGKKHAV